MWKYISGVSKVVDEKKNEKAPKVARDTKGIREDKDQEVFYEMASWPAVVKV